MGREAGGVEDMMLSFEAPREPSLSDVSEWARLTEVTEWVGERSRLRVWLKGGSSAGEVEREDRI